MYELNPNEFLYLFYNKLEQKLKRVLDLTENKTRNTKETQELFETKDKLITAIDMLTMKSNDNKLKESFNTLASLIISTKPNDIKYALNYCSECRI